MTPDQLSMIGIALYGIRWKTDLALALDKGPNGARTVRRWAAGTQAIPDITDNLLTLICAKKDNVDEAYALLMRIKQEQDRKNEYSNERT